MLEILSNRPIIILITAYKEYAIEGYNYNVIDYLVKPFHFKSFMMTIDKVINKVNTQMKNTSNSYLILKVDRSAIKVNFYDILYIQVMGIM